MERAFDFDYYWRRLGLSDVLSWITGALFLIAFFDVTAIYEKEDWLKDSYVGIRIAAFFFMFPLLHVAFKIDHGCPNNYIGRVFHDCFFLIAFSVVVYLYRVITNLNGKSLDKYTAPDESTDKYFNKGYGKMYLMR